MFEFMILKILNYTESKTSIFELFQLFLVYKFYRLLNKKIIALGLGDIAPDFSAETTDGIVNFHKTNFPLN